MIIATQVSPHDLAALRQLRGEVHATAHEAAGARAVAEAAIASHAAFDSRRAAAQSALEAGEMRIRERYDIGRHGTFDPDTGTIARPKPVVFSDCGPCSSVEETLPPVA